MCTRQNFRPRSDLMLFDYRTTYRTDYRHGEILPPQEQKLKPRPKAERKQREFRLIDTQTLAEYRDPNFPFDLLAVPKEIIRTYFKDEQQTFEKPVDKDLEKARKMRPRVVMVPAASLDDMEDPKQRQLILDETYTTTTNEASRVIAAKYDNSRTHAPWKCAPNCNPLAFQKLIEHPYVHPEFRWQSLSWEREQLRGVCNPTKSFWTRRPIPKQSRSCQK